MNSLDSPDFAQMDDDGSDGLYGRGAGTGRARTPR